MKKILFPTDFSDNSNNAFVYALKLAEKLNAEVITLHVYQFPVLDSSYMTVPIYQAEVYESIELNSFENYKSQIPALHAIAESYGLAHIKVSNVLLEGDLVYNILQLAKSENVDYVVLGTHGASGMKEVFLGSTAASVMTGTNALVLGIPEESKYETIEKIGFATQYHPDDFKALQKVLQVAKRFDAQIECIYVKTPDNEVNEVIIADWSLIFKEEKISFTTIESKDVEETIMDFIELHKIDLFALLNHRRGFWESFFHTSMTKKLAYHTKVPLLAIHVGNV